jgi:hypothetical protein
VAFGEPYIRIVTPQQGKAENMPVPNELLQSIQYAQCLNLDNSGSFDRRETGFVQAMLACQVGVRVSGLKL